MTNETAYPPVRELLAQQGQMVLLERIDHHDAAETRCQARAGACEWFLDRHGELPAWALIEFMAQCVAVHGNLAARERGETIYPGLLLGSRTLKFDGAFVDAEEDLEIVAQPHRLGNLASFRCEARSLTNKAPLATGRLNVLRLRNDPGSAEGGAS